MEEKQFWFITYMQYTHLGDIIGNMCIGYSPVEWAATYRERFRSEHRHKPIVTFAMEISQEEYEKWKDHF